MAIRPLSWKALAPSPPPNTLTFAGQKTLPKLPVPSLSETLSRLKESLRPLARNYAELVESERKIDEFATDTGLGKILQKRLEERREQEDHWLEEWWDTAGYLGYRDSVVVNVTYYYGFDAHPSHLSQTPAARAAALTRTTLIFRQQLKCGQLAPESTKEGPLCMDTYRWMFDCARVPAIPNDYSVTYAQEGSTGDEGHVVVFRKNRPWKIQCFDNGRLLSLVEFERQFQYIYDNTATTYPGVGVLTASNRDIWTKDYELLSSLPANEAIVTTIHSAAFTVSLDESTPTDPVHYSRALWHGDVSSSSPPVATGLMNRWCDKPVQFIVFDNTCAGIMGEHSIMDGTPTARMCDDVLEMIANPRFDHGSSPATATTSVPQPMDWTVNPALSSAIDSASKEAVALIDSQKLSYHLTSYGKKDIKRFGVSPDGWAQMIIQLAYSRLLAWMGSPRKGATYEAATTRRFYKGRTEAIRVVSNESDAWVRAMDDPTATVEARKAAFATAIKRHGADARRSGQGMGVDRHLLGLKKLLKPDEALPALYSDPLVQRASNWVLSTSSVFSKHFPVYGWGEVVPDGFGLPYMTGYDDRLQYTLTSRKEMPNERFIQEIAKAAEDLYALHTQAEELKARL